MICRRFLEGDRMDTATKEQITVCTRPSKAVALTFVTSCGAKNAKEAAMDESRFRVSYYSSEKEGTIAIDLDDLHKMLNTGHGYHKITKSRPSRFCDVVGRSKFNDAGGLVFVMEAGALEIEPMDFDPVPRLVDIGERGREHPVPMPNVSKPGIATEEHPLILPCKWETITESKGIKKDEETVTIALDDLQQILNAGYGSHEITRSRSSGSVSIVRRGLHSPADARVRQPTAKGGSIIPVKRAGEYRKERLWIGDR